MSKRIPVYSGPRIIEMVDAVGLRRYLAAPNAEPIYKRKTREVVQVNLRQIADDSELRSRAGGRAFTYEESLDEGKASVMVLKRYDETQRAYVRWSDQDGFDPFRFNPDRIKPLNPGGVVKALAHA